MMRRVERGLLVLPKWEGMPDPLRSDLWPAWLAFLAGLVFLIGFDAVWLRGEAVQLGFEVPPTLFVGGTGFLGVEIGAPGRSRGMTIECLCDLGEDPEPSDRMLMDRVLRATVNPEASPSWLQRIVETLPHAIERQ